MPNYSYRNPVNDEVFQVFMTLDEFDAHTEREREIVIFPDGKVGYRDMMADTAKQRIHAGNWPMVSVAMGVAAEDGDRASKEMDRLGVPTEHRDGNPVLTSPGHRKAYAEALGFYDRNGGYSDPQRNKSLREER